MWGDENLITCTGPERIEVGDFMVAIRSLYVAGYESTYRDAENLIVAH